MSGIPLAPEAFPHAASIYPSSYPVYATGATPRADGEPVACPCNLVLDVIEPAPRSAGEAIGSHMVYDVSFPGPAQATDAQLAAIRAIRAGDQLDVTVNGQTFVTRAVGPAAPVMAGAWYRARVSIDA